MYYVLPFLIVACIEHYQTVWKLKLLQSMKKKIVNKKLLFVDLVIQSGLKVTYPASPYLFILTNIFIRFMSMYVSDWGHFCSTILISKFDQEG